MSCTQVTNKDGPPDEAIGFGHQDGRIMYSVIAHTEFGPIGAKATRDTCYYSFGGNEHQANDFSWITAPKDKVEMIRNEGSPPANAVSLGRQKNDNVEYFAALAICDHDLIPGKAGRNNCWYALGGKETCTSDFWWLVTK